MKRLYAWMDDQLLPWPVKFLTNPLVIIVTFLLLVPMIGLANIVTLVLALNSYTNVTSVGVSSIVLRKQLLGEDAQEKRTQETHDAVMAEFAELKQMHAEQGRELAEIRGVHREIKTFVRLSDQDRQRMLEYLESRVNPKVR